MDFNQIIQSFQAEMLANGINPPDQINADGELHRFYIQGDKRGSKNGWYIINSDYIPCGVFGSWKVGKSTKWCAKKREHMNSVECVKFQHQIVDIKRQRDTERTKMRGKAAKLAERIYRGCSPVEPNHPYLIRKRISPYCARQCGKNLVLPIKNIEGKIWSLQHIMPSGDKLFLANGAVSGHFIPVQGWPANHVKNLICEGFSTGATLAEAYPQACVIAACNAGNLKPVALGVRKHLPDAEIIICADDDRLNPDNPGLTNGRDAAIASGSLLTKPDWPEGAPDSLTDFNDLACWIFSQGALA